MKIEPRLNYSSIAPDGYQAMRKLDNYVKSSELDPSLLELVKLRSSQINGCAYCIDMHTKDARSPDRERAALAWTEAVTQVAETHVPDDVYELAHKHFTEKELVDLTLAIIVINGWNRLAISFRTVPGSYQPAHRSVE